MCRNTGMENIRIIQRVEIRCWCKKMSVWAEALRAWGNSIVDKGGRRLKHVECFTASASAMLQSAKIYTHIHPASPSFKTHYPLRGPGCFSRWRISSTFFGKLVYTISLKGVGQSQDFIN